MSDPSDAQAGAPPVTNPDVLSALGKQSVPMTGGGPLSWEPPTIEEAARLFPNYEILGLLGRGGMGAVYKARQVALDRLVAIKLLPLEVSVNKDFADRFVREARTMAKLNHPNIIDVYDFGTTSEGHLFFVMEFVAGANLHSIIHEVGLDPDQALYLAGEVCAALAYAHGKGVVHRDIKPANVMVNGESHVKVADFGLARLTDVSPEMHGMTMTGMVMGTPDYMAPEQKRGMNVDARADIYSVGVMLYEMVCREVPQGAFDLPSRRTGCDQRLDAIVLKAMNQSPERRYQNTKEMEAAMEAARKPVDSAPIAQPLAVVPQAELPVPAPRPGAPGPVPGYAAPQAVTAELVKNRTPLYAGIAAAVLVAIIVIVMALPKSKPKLSEERAQPETSAAKEQPSAITPATKPTPSPVAQTPNEQPAANAPDVKPAPPPTPEPPKERPVANTPEMKPAPAPEPSPTPPPAVAPEQSATAKWLAEQEPQWQAAFALEVTGAFDKGVAELKKQYLSALDAQLATATRNGDLTLAVACRDELQRLNAGGAPGEDDATTPVGLKATRSSYHKNFALLETERAARAKAVHARYDSILAQNLTLLTQRQRLDEALQLKAKREELAASWLKPLTLPEAPKPPPAPTTPVAKFGTARIADATKERPFENSLGMKFVPVPITGTSGGQRVLFSIWETRVQDYEGFVNEKGMAWPKATYSGPAYPAVNASWDDAQAFCAWLTDRERKGGRLGATERYRLPTDHEWSCAVGIGEQEDPAKTPQEKTRKIPDVFPWGSDWPSPPMAGNYSGVQDGFPSVAPVGSFAANRFGLYDLGGNVREWCEDFTNSTTHQRTVRGASFLIGSRLELLSSARAEGAGNSRRPDWGFRVVVSAAGLALTTPEVKVAPVPVPEPVKVQPLVGSTGTMFGSGRIAEATKERPFVNSLGMEFVPVPGTQLLFCRWETRVKDYAAYAQVNTVNDSWTKVQYNGVPAGREPEHPVSSVTWEEANAFCEWLTKKENAEGKLPKGMNYRLPTDEEWSRAVGLAKEQGATPRERSGKNSVGYPWGSGYPPPKAKVGNYADSACHEKFSSMKWLEGYTDGYATTAPVGSFAPNPFGIYDLGGNVWEWCEDVYEARGTGRVLRGASWSDNGSHTLLSSTRYNAAPNWRNYNHGFRCVVGASAR